MDRWHGPLISSWLWPEHDMDCGQFLGRKRGRPSILVAGPMHLGCRQRNSQAGQNHDYLCYKRGTAELHICPHGEQPFLLKVHYRSDGNTLLIDDLPRKHHEMLTELHSLFGKPIYPNCYEESEANWEIKMDPNGRILFCTPYHIPPREVEEHRRQIDKAIRSGWIQPSQSNSGAPVTIVATPDGTLCMFIDDGTVNDISIQDHYDLMHQQKKSELNDSVILNSHTDPSRSSQKLPNRLNAQWCASQILWEYFQVLLNASEIAEQYTRVF